MGQETNKCIYVQNYSIALILDLCYQGFQAEKRGASQHPYHLSIR